MGIPTYTRRLLSNNKSIVINELNNIDNIFLDFNAFIHPEAHKLMDKYTSKSHSFIEKELVLQCVKKLNEIIIKLKPKKLIYVAIDGVAPFAKIQQQRSRRYKTIEHNFDKNCISPGTNFMKLLARELSKIKNIVVSNADIPSEGEHKILNYVRNNNCKNDINVFCSLDADFFMLSMISYIQDCGKLVYIYRDEQDQEMINLYGENYFIDIEKFITTLTDIIQENVNFPINKKLVIQDYIILCFFCGNDFLPHLNICEIRFKGIDELLKIYYKFISNSNYISNENEINSEQLFKFFKELQNNEERLIKIVSTGMHKWTPKTRFNSKKEEELYKEQLLYPVYDPIKYSKKNWKDRYYPNLFNNPNEEDITNICKNYVKMIFWNFDYYFGKEISWKFYYHYHYAPLLEDIINNYNLTEIKFEKDEPYRPDFQLLLMLPPKSMHLSNNKCLKIVNNEKYNYLFPKKVFEDITFANMKWQAKVLFYPLDLDLLELIF